eukprot:2507552-Amphidinium_carterae.2
MRSQTSCRLSAESPLTLQGARLGKRASMPRHMTRVADQLYAASRISMPSQSSPTAHLVARGLE